MLAFSSFSPRTGPWLGATSEIGMMALTDASRHDWLQGRGPQLTLIGFQDDATGQILAAHFQLEAENTLGYPSRTSAFWTGRVAITLTGQ